MPTLKPFTGSLDTEKQSEGLKPFSGKLDDDEEGIWDKVKGLEHAVTGMATQVPGALGGGFNYLTTLAATQDPAAAMEIKQATEKAINDVVEYKPKDAAGKRYQENVGKAMQHAIEFGGRYPEQLAGTFGVTGFTPAEKMAMESAGKAGAEIGMNLLDPMLAVGLVKGGIGLAKGRGAKAAAETPISKLEALDQIVASKEPTLRPFNGELDQTAAHADDFAAINPYDVGGHVSAQRAGRPSTIDQGQGELFGGENLQPAQAQPTGGPLLDQTRYGGNEVPYEVTLGEPAGAVPPKAPLEMPVVERPFNYDLEPKEQTPAAIGEQPVTGSPTESNLALEPIEQAAPAEVVPKTRYQLAQEKIAKQEEAVRKAEESLAARKAQREHEVKVQEAAQQAEKGKQDFQYAESVLNDKSLMSGDATQSMRQALDSGDAVNGLKAISDNHPNVGIKNLAQYLMSKAEGLKMRVSEEGILRMGDRNATGYFDPNSGEIVLSSVGATSPHTVMHEIVHGLTSQFMQLRPNDLRVKAMQNLFNKVDLSKYPAIINAREFVAEAFSHPEFQNYLKNTYVDSRSAWGRFTDLVKSMIGVPTKQLGNAFDQVMDLGKQIIEASDAPTRKTMLEQFKAGGVPKAIADLMAKAPEKPEFQTKQPAAKIPGLTDAVSDFKFFDKPVEDIIQMARENTSDIPDSMLEKAAQQLQAGALFASLKSRNPVIKYTYERITRATQEATRNIRQNLTDQKTGLISYMRALNSEAKGEIWNAMMKYEGERVLSTEELRAAGMSEKQVAFYNQYRELSTKFLNELNAKRAEVGLKPIEARTAHLAGRFMGDFSRFVTDASGKITGRISGSTKWELDRASKWMAENHPEWSLGKVEYNGLKKGQGSKDRFSGMMEAINFIEKADPDVKAVMDSYREYLQSDATNYLNAVRHAKAKQQQAGGIVGSEGNKYWKSAEKNAEEGMKAQMSYFEQGYEWMSMQGAAKDLKNLFGDETVVRNQPNAVRYSTNYVDHALGRNQGPLSDAANYTASLIGEMTGIGHSNLFKASNAIKHAMMQKFMGLGNIPFSLTQLMQPFQTNPAMVQLLKGRGLEFSARDAQIKASETFLKASLDEWGVKNSMAPLTEWEKAAVKYANETGISDVAMANHTRDINASKFKDTFDYVADFNITVPEKLTRGTTFLFYSHLLKDAGIPTKDIFGAAENMTNFTMVNYHPIERPMGYAKLGWLGDLASTLTRYKHNQLSQLAFYAREGGSSVGGSYRGLSTMLATSLAFGGIMGFFGYQEADQAYQLIREKVFKSPDSLTNQVLKSGAPEVVTHGLFSLLGLDMTSRFSNANVLPDSAGGAMLPYGSAIWDMAAATGQWAVDPLSLTRNKQVLKAFAPQSAQGILENQMFTDEKGLYWNSTNGPNFGKGRVVRDESTQMKRNFGFRTVGESKELASNYSNSQIEQAHGRIADNLIDKAKVDLKDGDLTPLRLQALIRQASDHGMDPNTFMGKLTSWSIDAKLTQQQQMMLNNAQKGYKGAFNIKEQR